MQVSCTPEEELLKEHVGEKQSTRLAIVCRLGLNVR